MDSGKSKKCWLAEIPPEMHAKLGMRQWGFAQNHMQVITNRILAIAHAHCENGRINILDTTG